MLIVDSHSHVWPDDQVRYPEPRPRESYMYRRAYTPDDFFAQAAPSGVSKVVLIQSDCFADDHSYITDQIAARPGVFGGVALVDIDHPPKGETLEGAMLRLSKQGVRGFRVQSKGKTPTHWRDHPGVAAMLRCASEHGLAFCPLIDADALPIIDHLAFRFPKANIVIDHLARIGVGGVIRESDVARLCTVGMHQNVFVKVSAFYALGNATPPYGDMLPMVRRVIDAFSPRRAMWGSDCPYQTQSQPYDASIAVIRDHLPWLSHVDKEWLLGRTAERVYFG